LWEASGGGRKKLVAVYARGDAAMTVVRFHAQHVGITTYVDIACERDLLRQGKDKLNGRTGFDTRLNREIKSSEADVARFALLFQHSIFERKSHNQGQHHGKTACSAAFHRLIHLSSQGNDPISSNYHRFQPTRNRFYGGFAQLPALRYTKIVNDLMADTLHRNFFLNGSAGKLEALLWTAPNPNPPMAALVCHPHPLFGGTMHNKVVYQTAKALHRRGLPILRFNFRGAGSSEGEHDRGQSEQEDVRSALDYLSAEFPATPVLLAGFSFGSWVGLRVGCADDRVAELIGLGLPVDNSDLTYLRECIKPKLLIQGGYDQFGARANMEALFETLPEPKRLVIINGADHFFTGQLDKVTGAIDAWLDEHHSHAVELPSKY
jgi:alpha/beta superfamily hydrolase